MPLTRADAEAIAQEGIAALQRGDAALARARLALIEDDASGFPTPWLLIAQAAQATGDDDAAEAALARQLGRDMRDLLALLLMAALKARRGDERAAQAFYQTALAVASQPGASVPPPLVPLLRAGEAFLVAAAGRFGAHLERRVATLGIAPGPAGTRLRQSLDLLTGRSELYLQQPSMFYFPGLPQRAFFERDEFPWLAEIEAAVPAMRDEALAVRDDGFRPYVASTPDRPPPANPLLDDDRWGAFYLWQAGARVEPNASRCPATMAALERAPIPAIADRSPMALFSRLRPGTHIRPHHGLLNTRLICHVPLIAPEGCALRVGAETRSWREGEALIFDDSFEHEAWNQGTSDRVVLLFEIWRPELTADECGVLTAIFEAIDTYQSVALDTG